MKEILLSIQTASGCLKLTYIALHNICFSKDALTQVRWFRLLFSFMLLFISMGFGSQWPDGSVVNIAHRGGIIPGYPENTLAAFRNAISLGVDVIEIDLRESSDGEIVILHDETVDRTTDGSGRITEYTLRELKKLNAGYGNEIPTYKEVLHLVSGSRVKLLLDIKTSPGLDKPAIIRITQEYGTIRDIIIGVRNLDDLKQFQQINSDIITLGFISKPEEVTDYLDTGVNIIRLWPEWLKADKDLLKKIQGLGKQVWVTANGAPRDELEKLIHLGVNGILSDFPKIMADLLSEIKVDPGDR